jgi:type VI secretion system (T6SS) amidase immunity protein Tai4
VTLQLPHRALVPLVLACACAANGPGNVRQLPPLSQPTATSSPQAAGRTYAQNYKDMLLALCIANAYAQDQHAARDAGSSFSALRDWTNYDMDSSPDAIKALVDGYLARNYRNPLVEAEVKGVGFDFLKCLDLYHGPELDAQVKQFVLTPERTYRQDNPPSEVPRAP